MMSRHCRGTYKFKHIDKVVNEENVKILRMNMLCTGNSLSQAGMPTSYREAFELETWFVIWAKDI
jgi:hypothetical protein